MKTLWQDLKYGVRMLFKHKGFTFAVVLSLAVGIGANTAIFSLIDTLLLKSLPVKDPQQLVQFSIIRQGGTDVNFDYPMLQKFKQGNRSFDGIIAFNAGDNLRMSVESGGVESVQTEQVSGNYFSVLGVGSVAGRTLTEDDDKISDPQPVVVISYDFWQRRFGLDKNIVGRKITLNDFPFTIIGVAPKGFTGLEVGGKPELWWSLGMTPHVYPGRKWLNNKADWLLVMGRLRQGVSPEQARAEMDLIHQQQLKEIPAERLSQMTTTQRNNYFGRRIELEPGGKGWTIVRKQVRQPLLILMIAVGLVLLIACANVANLLLARAAARQREIAVRLTLGAGRLRVIRQLLTESILLAIIGGALGLVFAYWGTGLLLTYLPKQRPVFLDISPDLRALGFTFAVSLLTGILFGLAPALRATRLDITTSLKEKAGGSTGSPRLALNKVLIVTQVALSLFLLIGAGLFIRSLQNLKSMDAGFEREGVVVFSVDPGYGMSVAQQTSMYKDLLARLESQPGVRAASVSQYPPLRGGTIAGNSVEVPGYTPPAGADTSSKLLWVGKNYFETMGIQLLHGRDFNTQEEQPIETNDSKQTASKNAPKPAPLPAIINQKMAHDFFGDKDPLGKDFYQMLGTQKGTHYRVIGVVKDSKYGVMREPQRRAFYVSYFQNPGDGALTFMLSTTGSPANYYNAIQQAAREVNPKLQVAGMKTMNNIVDESLTQERFVAQLAGFFSLFALLLACVGLYGIMSYNVTRRTNEIGIRMALGARSVNVMSLVMKETMLLVVVGVVIGLGAALAATHLVSSLLFGLTPYDPMTIVIATSLMILVADLAGYFPARRASKVEPMVALHYE